MPQKALGSAIYQYMNTIPKKTLYELVQSLDKSFRIVLFL